ncbi:MAG: hypothetical protein CMH31_06915 [Micavibrio sp.]|nr:hypothetical protein [Micavibrio sp.]
MTISKKLSKLQLISGTKVCEIFDALYPDILDIEYSSESEFMAALWSRYTPESSVLNGSVFEGLLAIIFYRSGIIPLYVQAKLSFVPNVDFDFVAYSKEFGPIVLSAKTSLRERYKQADLEGMMLRQVHRKSKSYLITLNEIEAKTVNQKIKEGLVLGLDDIVVATDQKFDALIAELKELSYYAPNKIDVLVSSRLIK